MPRRRLTAQDAFIGVRTEGTVEEPASTPAAAAVEETRAQTPPLPQLEVPERARPAGAEARTTRTRRPGAKVGERAAGTPDQELAATLRAAQEALAARAAVERLTLYLPPDLSGQLGGLWEEVREGANIRIGKSVLAGAALRIVLSDPGLRAQAAAVALREKLGRGTAGERGEGTGDGG